MTTSTREHRSAEGRDVGDLVPIDLEASAHRLERLPELVQSMGSTPAVERAAVATQINTVLIAMRAPGHETEESELLLELLSTKVLNEQLDTEGRSCRKEIVETLMACGFPHALQLDPEDVRFLRSWRDQRPVETDDDLAPWELSMRRDRRGGGLVMIIGQSLAVTFGLPTLLELPSVAAMVGVCGLWFLGVLAGLVLAVRRPRELNIASYGAIVTMLAIVGLGVALASGSPAFAVAPGSLMLGLFVSLMRMFEDRADPPRPGDWNYHHDV